MTSFDLQPGIRKALLQNTIDKLDLFYENTENFPVSPPLNVSKIRSQVVDLPLEKGLDSHKAISIIIQKLKENTVHTPHPMYFGLFNPRPAFPAIIADLITAWINPQLAAWSHAPYANEVETHLIDQLCQKFGYSKGQRDGVFCTGGGEANLTAVICALNHHFQEIADVGLLELKGRPIIYCSTESHHSIAKAARNTGLGVQSVSSIQADKSGRMIPEALETQIQKDQKNGNIPFMLIATAGTTGQGSIDPLNELGIIAAQENIWFHIDAAYGGAAAFQSAKKGLLAGIEKSQSITFDLHKWFSLPMATSVFLTSNSQILHQSFRINTEYMPKDADVLAVTDPYSHSIQWSRRFIGLKAYLAILVFGWEGYDKTIQHQMKMGDTLRKKLNDHHWDIKNSSELPVVCFTDPILGADPNFATYVCNQIITAGEAWVSVYPINGQSCIRACITNYATQEVHVEKLVQLLNKYRAAFAE